MSTLTDAVAALEARVAALYAETAEHEARLDALEEPGTIPVPPQPQPQPPALSPVYGVRVHATDLNNRDLGGSQDGQTNLQYSIRFLAEQSGPLTRFTHYVIGPGPAGYSGGDGGKMRARLYADDGTALHHPTGAVLSTSNTIDMPDFAVSKFPSVTFPTPHSVEAGQRYHIVLDNPHSDPVTNYSALDFGWTRGTSPSAKPRYPGYDNADLAILMRAGPSGVWDETWHGVAHFPIYQVSIGSSHQGVSYMEFWDKPTSLTGGQRKVLNGASLDDMARERIVPSATVTVTGFGLWLKRIAVGSGDLEVRLERGSTEMETVAVAVSGLPVLTPYPYGGSHNVEDQFVSGRFGEPHELVAGQTYHLRFRMSEGATTRLSLMAQRKGNGALPGFPSGYGVNCYFADGRAEETSNGTTWLPPVSLSGSRPVNLADWKCYLTTT